MRIFVICPVRGTSASDSAQYVADLEAAGHEVHWPHRDTVQHDTTGLRICRDNKAAIMWSEEVHFLWDGKSQGCLFDLGMAFALRKKVVGARLPAPSEGKSFQNMVRAWEVGE